MTELSSQAVDTRTSNRDLNHIQERLTAWLGRALGAGADPVITELRNPGKTGMSSETLLFDLEWRQDGSVRTGSYVARLPPPDDAFPIFSQYDFDRQVGVMRLVRKYSQVPVPEVLWYEPAADALGVPFFIMEMVTGEAASDNPPYVFGGWLHDARPEDQARMQEQTIAAIAGVHGIRAPAEETAFLLAPHPGATPLRRHFAGERAYYDWGRSGRHFPLVEKLFAWIEAHWPEDEGETVICWGDSRVGNMLWREFSPTAVLDWEMATLGPRELDVAWTILLHKYFQGIAALVGFPSAPMPHFMRYADVVASYERVSGQKLKNMDFYLAYGLLRMALVDIRITQRRIKFGEAQEPGDPDLYLMCRPLVEAVLAGNDPWN
ncbi:phosphotransferase family protein [Denitratisoma sp. DHT3]|uniref:phosphotransferase family protein n=1 Tax=Denitratisoma sp. DHT3 TaxID=1981880 RepID=UPI001646DE80|nr:phosphotransferase family protein [Denitratisoma sp. DHT3]